MKIISAKLTLILLILCLSVLTGCTETSDTLSDTDGKAVIMCSTFPQYDWVLNIVGQCPDTEVRLLISDGTEAHSFQPSAADIIKISESDMFIYNGGKSERAFEKIVSENLTNGQIALNMTELLGENILTEEHSGHNHSHNDADIPENDEHIWLSLRNAIFFCERITDELARICPEHEQLFRNNCNSYTAQLSSLDERMTTAVEKAARKELVFADRFPFVYFMNDYGLSCHTAFSGCSSEADASFNTIISLAEKLDEMNCTKAAIIESGNSSVADAVREAMPSKQLEIFKLNSLQSVTSAEIEAGLTYLSAMEQNCNAVCQILN